MDRLRETGQEAPVPYCEGVSGRQNRQGEHLATSADPLAGGKSIGRQTGHGKSGEGHSGRRQDHLVEPGGQIQRLVVAGETRIPTSSLAPRLHSQEERQAPGTRHDHPVDLSLVKKYV